MMTTFYSTNEHDSVEYIPKEYDTMVKRSQEIVKRIAGSENKQVIILQTADNKIHEAIVDCSSDAEVGEQTLLNVIGKSDTVTRLICCWSNGEFDMPSYNFRKKLCELNPNNETARMLLNGEKNFNLKSIKDTFPNANSPWLHSADI